MGYLTLIRTGSVFGPDTKVTRLEYAGTIQDFFCAMLDREGATGLEDIAIVANKQTVKQCVNSLSMAGVTDRCVFSFEIEVGENERTVRFLVEAI